MVCAAGASTAGSAQTSLSLAEAQDKALDQAYAMERALIDVEVAKRDVKELLATGLPQVTEAWTSTTSSTSPPRVTACVVV